MCEEMLGFKRVRPAVVGLLCLCSDVKAQTFYIFSEPMSGQDQEVMDKMSSRRMDLDRAREDVSQAMMNEEDGKTFENGWITSAPPLGQAAAEYERQVFLYNAESAFMQGEVEARRQESARKRQEDEIGRRAWQFDNQGLYGEGLDMSYGLEPRRFDSCAEDEDCGLTPKRFGYYDLTSRGWPLPRAQTSVIGQRSHGNGATNTTCRNSCISLQTVKHECFMSASETPW